MSGHKLENSQTIKHLTVSIEGTQMLLENGSCTPNDEITYDQCMLKHWTRTPPCQLPYFNTSSEVTLCEDPDNGGRAMELVTKGFHGCTTPCLKE